MSLRKDPSKLSDEDITTLHRIVVSEGWSLHVGASKIGFNMQYLKYSDDPRIKEVVAIHQEKVKHRASSSIYRQDRISQKRFSVSQEFLDKFSFLKFSNETIALLKNTNIRLYTAVIDYQTKGLSRGLLTAMHNHAVRKNNFLTYAKMGWGKIICMKHARVNNNIYAYMLLYFDPDTKDFFKEFENHAAQRNRSPYQTESSPKEPKRATRPSVEKPVSLGPVGDKSDTSLPELVSGLVSISK